MPDINDSQFYKLIYQLYGSPRLDDQVENRERRRNPFKAVQRIAPLGGSELGGSKIPDEGEFFEVQCHDLSSGGFAFLARTQPEFNSLVVALGTPENIVHVAAEIAHHTTVWAYASGLVEVAKDEVTPEPDAGGAAPELMVLVGCRFTHRLDQPDEEQQVAAGS